MKWKTKPPRWKHIRDDVYQGRRFAWLPTQLDDGTTVWLCNYLWVFKWYSTFAGDHKSTISERPLP